MWPSDATNCPDDTNVVISATGAGNAITKRHDFTGTMPNTDAQNWHCKWKISADSSLLPQPIAGTTVA